MQSMMNICFLMRRGPMRKKDPRLICVGGALTAYRQGWGAMPSGQGGKRNAPRLEETFLAGPGAGTGKRKPGG